MKRIKQFACVLTSMSLCFCLIGCNSHSTQQGEIKITETTEAITEELTTEKITEPPTEEHTEPEPTEAVTEKVTDKPTEPPTEKKTDALVEENIINVDDEEYNYWQEEDGQEQQVEENDQSEIEEDPASQFIVYYTKSGECYHYENPCGRGTYYECTLSEAESKGLRPCNKCVN